MIPKKMVDRYAHQSGVKDQLVAEREVFLTYALHALLDANALDLLAFKGGTCLRKIVFGSTGRFSEDLDFTLCSDDDQDALVTIYEVFNGKHHGVQFALDDDWYETDDGFGMEVRYTHEWNRAGKFRLQVSTREKPTLAITPSAMVEQVYFSRTWSSARSRSPAWRRSRWRLRRSGPLFSAPRCVTSTICTF